MLFPCNFLFSFGQGKPFFFYMPKPENNIPSLPFLLKNIYDCLQQELFLAMTVIPNNTYRP